MRWSWWRRQPASTPVDDEVRSAPLDTERGAVVIEQAAAGRENVRGGGEWPDPDAEPAGPAPGTDAATRDQIESDRRARAERDHVDHGLKDAIEADDNRKLGLS